MKDKLALVTGGNRGIGYEICKQLLEKKITVILSTRNKEKGTIAIEKLGNTDQLIYQRLDLSDSRTFKDIIYFIDREFGKLDILVNNAGINLESSSDTNKEVSALNPNYDDILKMFEINTLNTIKLTNYLIPTLRKSKDARIINLSSSMGQLTNMDKGSIGYRLSKTGLNVMTRVFSKELQGSNIRINSVSPGWVQTDMGGANGRLKVEDSVETIIWLATEPNLKINGRFLKDKTEIDW